MTYGPIPKRYWLTLSTFAGFVPGARHWWCRVHWLNNDGRIESLDAEHGRGDGRTGRFDAEAAARSAGLRLARTLANGGYYTVTEGDPGVVDPQRTLSAPGNLKARLNSLWRAFEKLDGWRAPKSKWVETQKICDSWSHLIGERA